MPPATFISKATGLRTGARFDFTVPKQTRAGDEQVIVIGADPTVIALDPAAAGAIAVDFTDVATAAAANVIVARRLAKDTDPPVLSVFTSVVPAWALGVLLVYRDMAGAAAVGFSGTAIAGSTNFVCPSRVLVQYSDLYLGLVAVATSATNVTPPINTTERHGEQAGARTLEVFEWLAEAPGATGTKTATVAVGQNGIAASIAIATKLARLAKAVVPDVPGAIGFVDVGV